MTAYKPLYRGHPDFRRPYVGATWTVLRPTQSPAITREFVFAERAEAEQYVASLPAAAAWWLRDDSRLVTVASRPWDYWPTDEQIAAASDPDYAPMDWSRVPGWPFAD